MLNQLEEPRDSGYAKEMDLDRLKVLLENESFPHDFTVKFIGSNSRTFADGVRAFEAGYPQLRKQAERRSANDANLALTYVFPAQNADEIVSLLKRVSEIPDVKVIL